MTAANLLDKWQMAVAVANDPRMSRADVAVAMTLLGMINADGTTWPTMPTLATRTGQSRRNVIRCVERLRQANYFTVADGRGRGHSKIYRANFAKAEKVTPASSIIPDETVTAMSPIEIQEKVTPESPINPSKGDGDVTHQKAERVTPASIKGDTGVQEKVTPESHSTCLMYQSKYQKEEIVLADGSPAADVERDFQIFWAAFPKQRRAAREKTLAKFRSILRGGKVTAADLIAGARRYSASDDVLRGYACAPLRWLGEERWLLDQPSSARRPNGVDVLAETDRLYRDLGVS
jgi:hypothetical protein